MNTWGIRAINQKSLILLIFSYFVGSLCMTQVVGANEENSVIKGSNPNGKNIFKGKDIYDESNYCFHPKNSSRPPRDAPGGLPQIAWSCALPLWQGDSAGSKKMKRSVNETNEGNEGLNGKNNTLKLRYLSVNPTGFEGTRHRLSGGSPPSYNSYFGATPIKTFYRL